MEPGLKNTLSVAVTADNTAVKLGSGEIEVFATPAMIALMEETASKCVKPFLDEGQTTVGTLVNVKHTAATPVGMTVTCEAELTEIDGRRLVFTVKAFDNAGAVGEGIHERFIVDGEKFRAKALRKLN